MPSPAKVFIVESDPQLRELVRKALEAKNYRVVAEAGSVEDAIRCLPRLAELRPDVAIIATHVDTEGPDGSDGAEVDSQMSMVDGLEGAAVIAWSSSPKDYDEWSILPPILKCESKEESARVLAETLADKGIGFDNGEELEEEENSIEAGHYYDYRSTW